VISILGLMLAAGIPAISQYQRASRVKGVQDVLVGDLHYARSQASMNRVPLEIVFSSNSYALRQASPPDTLRVRNFPRGVTCAATDTASFFPWGLTSPVVVTVNGTGASRTLRLHANGSVTHD